MLSEAFIHGDSIPHRLDPRLRIVFTFVFSCLIAVSQDFTTLAAGLAVAVFLILLSRLPLLQIIRRLALINGFNLLLLLILPVTYEGTALFAIGHIEASREGALLAAQITLKANVIVIVFIALLATMSIATLGNALNLLRLPEKLVYLLLIAYRYVFVLEREYERLVTAMRVRGFKPGTNIHTYRTYAYLFGMILVLALSRADRVYQAMLCRGFQGRFYCLREFTFSGLDRIWLFLFALIIVLLGNVEWLNNAL